MAKRPTLMRQALGARHHQRPTPPAGRLLRGALLEARHLHTVWHPEVKPQHTACKVARPPTHMPWLLPVPLVVERRHMELTVDLRQVVPGPALWLLRLRLTVPRTVHQRQQVMEHRHLLSRETLTQLQRLMVHPLPMLHRLPVCLLFQPLHLDRALVLRLHRLGLRHHMELKATVLLLSSNEVGLRTPALLIIHIAHVTA